MKKKNASHEYRLAGMECGCVFVEFGHGCAAERIDCAEVNNQTHRIHSYQTIITCPEYKQTRE